METKLHLQTRFSDVLMGMTDAGLAHMLSQLRNVDRPIYQELAVTDAGSLALPLAGWTWW